MRQEGFGGREEDARRKTVDREKKKTKERLWAEREAKKKTRQKEKKKAMTDMLMTGEKEREKERGRRSG